MFDFYAFLAGFAAHYYSSTAPFMPDVTTLRYRFRKRLSTGCTYGFPLGAATGEFGLVHQKIDFFAGMSIWIRSPSRTRARGRPVAASGEMWPIRCASRSPGEPAIGDERDSFVHAHAGQCRRRGEHSRAAGPPLGLRNGSQGRRHRESFWPGSPAKASSSLSKTLAGPACTSISGATADCFTTAPSGARRAAENGETSRSRDRPVQRPDDFIVHTRAPAMFSPCVASVTVRQFSWSNPRGRVGSSRPARRRPVQI